MSNSETEAGKKSDTAGVGSPVPHFSVPSGDNATSKPSPTLTAFYIPGKADLNPGTGLIHTSVVRENRNFLKNVATMKLDCGIGHQPAFELKAVKTSGMGTGIVYNIFDKDGDRCLGQLSKTSVDRNSIQYTLYFQGMELAVFHVSVASIKTLLGGNRPPRKVHIMCLTEIKKITESEQTLAQLCQTTFSQNGDLHKLRDVPSAVVMENVLPLQKADGTYVLNFGGRGNVVSNKNIQFKGKNNQTRLQMCKAADQLFHVDYASPFTAFHAFGMALVQFDV